MTDKNSMAFIDSLTPVEAEDILTKDQVVDGYLKVAKIVEAGGNLAQTEQILKSALAIAIRSTGDDIPSTGCTLFELWDFYERNGREAEALHAWDRLSSLIVKHQDWLMQ
ncbi:MAG: hypothetical protein GC193_11995 [Cryomorphaceae bacterium]|nr:hypothetical protein [Cryomorphaceae bacterium]